MYLPRSTTKVKILWYHGNSWNDSSWNDISWNDISWNASSWNDISWNDISWNVNLVEHDISWNASSWNYHLVERQLVERQLVERQITTKFTVKISGLLFRKKYIYFSHKNREKIAKIAQKLQKPHKN
jgi:hypothetical protein